MIATRTTDKIRRLRLVERTASTGIEKIAKDLPQLAFISVPAFLTTSFNHACLPKQAQMARLETPAARALPVPLRIQAPAPWAKRLLPH